VLWARVFDPERSSDGLSMLLQVASNGARYGVVKPSFDLYASYLYNVMQQQGETPENVFGDTQQAWLNDKIQSN